MSICVHVTKDSNSIFATNERWAVAFICYGYGIKERNVNRGKMKDPLPRFNCIDQAAWGTWTYLILGVPPSPFDLVLRVKPVNAKIPKNLPTSQAACSSYQIINCSCSNVFARPQNGNVGKRHSVVFWSKLHGTIFLASHGYVPVLLENIKQCLWKQFLQDNVMIAASFQVFKPCAGLKCHLAIHICSGHLFGQGSVKKFSPPLKRKVLSSFKLYMFPNRKSQADLSRPMHLACMRDATNTRKTPNLHHTKLTPARC